MTRFLLSASIAAAALALYPASSLAARDHARPAVRPHTTALQTVDLQTTTMKITTSTHKKLTLDFGTDKNVTDNTQPASFWFDLSTGVKPGANPGETDTWNFNVPFASQTGSEKTGAFSAKTSKALAGYGSVAISFKPKSKSTAGCATGSHTVWKGVASAVINVKTKTAMGGFSTSGKRVAFSRSSTVTFNHDCFPAPTGNPPCATGVGYYGPEGAIVRNGKQIGQASLQGEQLVDWNGKSHRESRVYAYELISSPKNASVGEFINVPGPTEAFDSGTNTDVLSAGQHAGALITGTATISGGHAPGGGESYACDDNGTAHTQQQDFISFGNWTNDHTHPLTVHSLALGPYAAPEDTSGNTQISQWSIQ